MKVIFSKNDFGGHYGEKILKKFLAKKDLLESFFQTDN
jgi:hypothetical protein